MKIIKSKLLLRVTW